MLDNNNTTQQRQVQVADFTLDIETTVTVYASRQGKYAEVSHMAIPPQATIRKLNNEYYQVIKTGEVRQYEKREDKNIKSVQQAMQRLTGIIRANFGYDPIREQHITLTYKSNMTDKHRLYRDFQVFWQRVRYHHKQHLEYVAIAEPQERGAWHLHVLVKSDDVLYFNYDKVRQMWRDVIGEKGATRHEDIRADDAGRYFAAYFSTIIPEVVERDGSPADIREASKAAIKGSRLHLYPAKFKFYRCSRGIVRPHVEKIMMDDILSEYPTERAKKRFNVLDEGGKIVQVIHKVSLSK